jgi:hypothetical protein
LWSNEEDVNHKGHHGFHKGTQRHSLNTIYLYLINNIYICKNIYKMKKQVTYTSTLPDELISQVKEYAEKYKMTKNKVIEEALKRYFFEQKRKEYEESFARIANDPETIELAEMGIADYAELLRKYEKDEL